MNVRASGPCELLKCMVAEGIQTSGYYLSMTSIDRSFSSRIVRTPSPFNMFRILGGETIGGTGSTEVTEVARNIMKEGWNLRTFWWMWIRI